MINASQSRLRWYDACAAYTATMCDTSVTHGKKVCSFGGGRVPFGFDSASSIHEQYIVTKYMILVKKHTASYTVKIETKRSTRCP